MTFTLGNTSRVLVNEMAVSGTLAGWTASHQRAASESTVLLDSGARFVPGLMSGSLVLRGPQDSVDQDLSAEIHAAMGVDNVFLATVCPYGTAIGTFAMTVLGDPAEHSVDASVSDTVGFTMTAQADESVDMGFVVHALGAESLSPLDIDPGTFESGAGGWEATGASFVQSSAQAHGGTQSGLMTVTGTPTQAYARPTAANRVPVTAGGYYQTTMWLRSAVGLSNVACCIDWIDAGGVYLSTSDNAGLSLVANTWTQVSCSAVAPVNAAFAIYGPTLSSNPATSTLLYIDDVDFAASGMTAAIDRGAESATTGGGVAVLHVTGYSGPTSVAVKIQHSTDNSVWADLQAFTSVTAVGAERKFLAAGTTINRYVRVVTDVTGTGSVTFLVALAPR